MITVTATEFHNRVGYYLDLLAKGKTVNITREKPQGDVIELTGKASKIDKRKRKYEKIMKMIEEQNYKSKYWKSGLEMQKHVRE